MRRRPVRPADALRYLDLALAEPLNSARRRALQDHALLVYASGKYWVATIGDRRRGGRRRYNDADMVTSMQKISKATGETRHFTLARHAVEGLPDGPDLKNAAFDSFLRRLVRAYRKASTDI
jgi:hypothetical protein